MSGVFHALYLLLFVLFAAPLVNGVPLAALGAVLAIVAWNMAEKSEFKSLLFASRGDAAVLLATFGLTVFVDLTTAIAVGVVLGAFLFLHRMAEAVEVQGGPHLIEEDRADDSEGRTRYDPATRHQSARSWSIASAARSSSAQRRRSRPCSISIGTPPKVLILDFQRRAAGRFQRRACAACLRRQDAPREHQACRRGRAAFSASCTHQCGHYQSRCGLCRVGGRCAREHCLSTYRHNVKTRDFGENA